MTANRWQRRGFSIIELSIVNVTVALLMTIAVPRLTRAMNRAKIVEAVQTASTIERLLLDYYNRFGQYPPVSAGQNPDVPVSAGRAQWKSSVAGWDQIGFTGPDGAYRYRYTVTTEKGPGSSRHNQAVIYAWSDVDMNGVESSYRIELKDGARVFEYLQDE
jgi:type II secretory pathway pseudopilin PulG